MRDHRQGNDLAVVWSILRDGKPFILSGKEWKLYLKNMYERKEVDDFSVKGNQIHWTFYGKDQKTTGRYSLILVGNENEKGMITTDTCDFVNVVSCSCKVKNSEDSPNVETETIELTSNLDYVAGTGGGGEGGGSYDDTAIWEALNDKVDKEEGKGLSTNDYTDEEREKLVGLANYDDSGIKKDIEDLSKRVEDLEQGGQGGSTPDLSEYLTKEEFNEVSERYATTDSLEDYLTKEEFSETIERYATTDALEDYLTTETFNEVSERFATTDALEGKQDTIEDLDGIRSGAGKGATAVQPSALEDYATTQQLTELSAEVGKKQDTISDLENIRNGAEKGATALQSVPEGYATKDYVQNAIKEIPQGGGGGGGTSNEWKCVFDGRMESGKTRIPFTTFADGAALLARELVVQILLDKVAQKNITGYIIIQSSTNTTRTIYGSVGFASTSATDSAPSLTEVRFEASPLFMVAKINPGVKCQVASPTASQVQGGSVKSFQIFENITYVELNPNETVADEYAPYVKIYAR